ncbi:MAG: cation-transporting P-type ATPase, partial [Inhella sp.]
PNADAPHARAMALGLLTAISAAAVIGLTGLRRPAARWAALGTLASGVVLIQWPASSRLLELAPLHGSDWGLIVVALVAVSLAAAALARRLKA